MPATVELRGVTKSFGDIDAVAATDLHVDSGEFVTLLGPSGCGKTTLLRLMAGLIDTDLGTLTIDGRSAGDARAAKQIGFVPQSPALLPWRTVRDNALLLTSLRSDRGRTDRPGIDELLDDVGLGGFTDAYPHELSGGMQQRVALVRAFALGARLLLMDEPFAALDEITRADMRHLLVHLRGLSGATTVFVTHSITEAAFLSDRVVVLTPRPGRIVDVVPIMFERPREPELEDRADFFETVTSLRSTLRQGGGDQ